MKSHLIIWHSILDYLYVYPGGTSFLNKQLSTDGASFLFLLLRGETNEPEKEGRKHGTKDLRIDWEKGEKKRKKIWRRERERCL